MWITVFYRVFTIISIYRQACFWSEFFYNICNKLEILVKNTPTESHNSSLCERYLLIIILVYNKIRADYLNIHKYTRLAISTHVVSNTARPDGLTSTLFLFYTVPRIALLNTHKLPRNHK